MTENLECLNRIIELAKQADANRVFPIGPDKTVFFRGDHSHEITCDSKFVRRDQIATLTEAVRYAAEHNGLEIWIDSECITLHPDAYLSDDLTHIGRLDLHTTPLFRLLMANEQADPTATQYTYRPDVFERIAKLYFDLDAAFISRLRKLQWHTKQDMTAKLTAADKSLSGEVIARVVDGATPFQDVSVTVQVPVFEAPCATTPQPVQVNIIANADTQTFSFCTRPGTCERIRWIAVEELAEKIKEIANAEKCTFSHVRYGCPEVKANSLF